MTPDDAASVGGSAAEATRAAKAAFVHITREQLSNFLEAQGDIVDPQISELNVVTEGAGASNGIALFHATYRSDGELVERDLVLRYMPGEQLLKQKSYTSEYLTMQALHAAGAPVPEVLWLDPDGGMLGCPGYVMERIDGRSPDSGMFLSGLLTEVSPGERKAMLLAAAGFHGALRARAIGPDQVPHLVERGRGDTPIEREVDWWLTEARLAAKPDDPKLKYLEELGEWMRHSQPAVRPATLVHGDAQIANIMFRDGSIAAAVDWELSYLGHNEADLALILFMTKAHGAAVPDMEGIPSPAEYIARYEQEAGGKAEYLEYFTVLTFLKVLSIYLMLGEKLPDLESIWAYHESLANAAVATATTADG